MRALIIFFIVACIPAFLLAQSGKIGGIVKERYTSKPIKSVQVKLIPSNRTALTDSCGVFLIDKLNAADYSIIFTKLGYLQYVIPSVSVSADSLIKLKINLEKVPPPVKDKISPVKKTPFKK